MRGVFCFCNVVASLMLSASVVYAQGFDSGSVGSDGALDVSTNTTLALPPDGIFHFTTVTVQSGATLTFTRNALNTPVFILATGDIIIDGTVQVNATAATSLEGGFGGAGGFDGGAPSIGGSDPGAGHGPGGGGPGIVGLSGNGAYGAAGAFQATNGSPYGSPLLVPLAGGSGGGGTIVGGSSGGGGGGGAILLASSTRILIRGSVEARGGKNFSVFGNGSGGGIRVVAPFVGGSGTLDVRGGSFDTCSGGCGGRGRVRIDVIDRSELTVTTTPSGAVSVGSFMTSFLDPSPRLDIVQIGNTVIPEGTQGPVEILIPFDSPTTQDVHVKATSFTGVVPIDVVLTPDSGPRIVSNMVEIDMGGLSEQTAVVPMDFPQNVPTRVHAWTRVP